MKDFLPQTKPSKKIKTNKTTKKTKKIKKTKSLSYFRNKCLKIAQKACKIRWQVENKNTSGLVKCISCGAMIPITEIQGGHFITRANRATEVLAENIHPQCSICNCLKHGNYHAYEFNLRKEYGDSYVNRLINMSMAREGNEEALKSLSFKDRELATMKKTAKWYEAETTRLEQEIKSLENQLDSMYEEKLYGN